MGKQREIGLGTGNTSLRDFLRRAESFESLDERSLELLAKNMVERSFGAGELICREGEKSDWMFVIAGGEVRVVKDLTDGATIQVAVLSPGDVGGIQSVFESRPRSASLLAQTGVTLWMLDRATFENLIRNHSEIAMAMLAFMSRRMRRDSDKLALCLQYVGDSSMQRFYERCSPQERLILDATISKIMSAESLDGIMDFLFDSLRSLSPCNRLSLAFVEEDGDRVVSHYTKADYEPLLLKKGYAGDLKGSSLERVLISRQPRIINDLAQYAREHQKSESTALILEEGIRSSMTCPLIVEGRPVGFLFRSCRHANAFDDHQLQLHLAMADRLSQAVEKAYRIEQLTSANQAYFEMLGFVSHELKSPVASAMMQASALLDGYAGPLEDSQRHFVERIMHKCKYLQDLVAEYLNLSRMESGQLEANIKLGVDVVEDVLRPAIDIVSAQAAEKQVRVVEDWPADLPAAECAPDLLQIVTVNLLSNAVKYGKPGGEVRLKVERLPHSLNFSVWNEGPGFPPEERPRLFRKFSRLQTPELLKQKGSGVGLYTTWRIIMLHGGKIDARSEHGKWAEFFFYIPQPLPKPKQPARRAVSERTPAAPPPG